MATNGQFSYITFLYDDIQWTVEDDYVGFFRRSELNEELPGSGTNTVSDLVTTSNVGVYGIWMYRVDSADGIIFPGPP